MPNFEVYQRPTPAPANTPTVTISRTSLHLNKHAIELLELARLHGRAGTIELLCDPETLIVGIRPVGDTADDATIFTVRTTRDGGGGRVDAPGFADRYNLPVDRRWPAYLDGGVLCVDASQPGENVHKQMHVQMPQPTGFITTTGRLR